jgi:hypothetical protein
VHRQPDGSLNVFANPTAVYNSLQFPLLSTQGQIPRDQMHQFAYWNIDFSIGKKIPITERVGLVLTADAFNVLNHTTFIVSPPALDLLNPSGFGPLPNNLLRAFPTPELVNCNWACALSSEGLLRAPRDEPILRSEKEPEDEPSVSVGLSYVESNQCRLSSR